VRHIDFPFAGETTHLVAAEVALRGRRSSQKLVRLEIMQC
jgi:hypothetical protein